MDSRLQAYQHAAQVIGRGTFDVALPPSGDDEIGRLGVAIQAMVQSLEGRFTELNRLLDLSARVNSAIRLEDVLDHVFESFQEVIPFDRIGLTLLDPDGHTARAVWARSRLGEPRLSTGYVADVRSGSLQRLLETGAPRVINDLVQYLEEHPGSEATRLMVEEGIRASLTCPLLVTGRAVGFLFFSSAVTDCYAHAHVDFFQKIATQLSWVIEKSRLYEELVRARDELHEANRRLERLAAVDGLTEVPNRRAFDASLEREWARARRGGVVVALILFDIDDFKAYNDGYGHLLGDEVLKRVARTLQEAFRRSSDLLCRFGGEEFAALMPGTDADGAWAVAERARAAVEGLGIPHSRGRAALRVTVSAGAAVLVPRPDLDSTALVSAADSALYGAKGAGRNAIRLYDVTDLPTEVTTTAPTLPPPAMPPSRPGGAGGLRSRLLP